MSKKCDKKNELRLLLEELIKIDSVNSWLSPGGADETEVLRYIADWLSGVGIETREEKVDGGHINLYGVLPGTCGRAGSGGSDGSDGSAGKGLTLYAHADTVGYELWKDRALIPRMDGDRLIGLGSADDKGHCAAIMMAAKILKERASPLRHDLHLAFVADEEGQTTGSFGYVKKHEPEACLILESGNADEINTTHQGFGWLRLRTFGKAGHGSAGASSVDAISCMAEVITRLQRNQRENFAKHPDPMNHETVYHTSYIKGGTDFASYPESCELGIEIGTQVGETIEDRIREIENIFAEIREDMPKFHGEVTAVLSRNPFVTAGSDGLYKILENTIEHVTGKVPRAIGDNSWGDAQIFQDAGFATLGIGAVGGGLHAPDEWVSLSGLESLTEILVETAEEYLK